MTVARPDRPAWADGFFAARDALRAWIRDSLRRQAPIPYTGGHDEGSFIASWFGLHQLCGAPEVLDFARFLRDGLAEWAREHMLHGFFRTGEAHHQTEIFTCFLARLWQVAPDDLTAELIVDAAHHIGNWVEGIPAWYDWQERRFLSWRIGTERVGTGAQGGYEVPDHFRLLQIALVAHRITGEQHYLDLCTGYADRWSAAILAAPIGEPPLILHSGGTPADREEALAATGAAHHGDSPLERVEPHVASDTIDVLLDLHSLTSEGCYAGAARRLCEALLPALGDPYSNPPGALLSRYRAATGDTSLDDAARQALGGRTTGEEPEDAAPVLIAQTLSAAPVGGIGKRKDMVRWGWELPDGALRGIAGPPPSSAMLAWQMGGEHDLAAWALRTVAQRVSLARTSLRDGRHHGCAGTSIGAVASGHGRDGGYGNVTGAFYPLAGMLRDLAQERPTVRFRRADGAEHLPDEVACLVRLRPGGGAFVWLWNEATEPLTLDYAGPTGAWTSVEVPAREVTELRVS